MQEDKDEDESNTEAKRDREDGSFGATANTAFQSLVYISFVQLSFGAMQAQRTVTQMQ